EGGLGSTDGRRRESLPGPHRPESRTPLLGAALHAEPRTRRFVLGITGASGAAYALRVIEQLLVLGHEVHLVASDYGRRLLFEEAGVRKLGVEELVPGLAATAQDVVARAALERQLLVHPHQ